MPFYPVNPQQFPHCRRKGVSTQKMPIFLGIVAIALASCFVGCEPQIAGAPKPTSPAPKSDANYRAQGRILPTGGVVNIASMPGDRIEEIKVRPGDRVTKGQVLVKLAGERLKENELALARQRFEDAKTQASAKKREAQLTKQAAMAQLSQAQKQLVQLQKQQVLVEDGKQQIALAEKQIERLQKLRDDPRTHAMIGSLELEQRRLELSQLSSKQQQAGVSSEQAIFAAEMAIELAQQKLEGATEALEIVESTMSLKSLEMQIKLLEDQIALSRVLAPCPGAILEVQAKVGESVSTLPLLTMADLSSMSCLAEVYEGNVGNLEVGARVEMSSAAFPDKTITGEIERIDRMVGLPQMRLPNPMAKTDFRAVPFGSRSIHNMLKLPPTSCNCKSTFNSSRNHNVF